MHELSLSESVLQILEDGARTEGYTRVLTVWLEVGELAAVDPQAMRFTFDAVSAGTLAQDARLEIVAVPGRARCKPCAAEVDVSSRFDACPRCGSHALQLIAGQELRVKELEVE